MLANFHEFVQSTQTEEEVLGNYASVVQWAADQDQFNLFAKEDFMREDNADAWLISFCLTYGVTLDP